MGLDLNSGDYARIAEKHFAKQAAEQAAKQEQERQEKLKKVQEARKNISRLEQQRKTLLNQHKLDVKGRQKAEADLAKFLEEQKACNARIVEAAKKVFGGAPDAAIEAVAIAAIKRSPVGAIVTIIANACKDSGEAAKNIVAGVEGLVDLAKEIRPSPPGAPPVDLELQRLERDVREADRKLASTCNAISDNKLKAKVHQRIVDKNQASRISNSNGSRASNRNGSIKPDKADSHRGGIDLAFNRPDISRAGGSFNPSRDSAGRDTCWT